MSTKLDTAHLKQGDSSPGSGIIPEPGHEVPAEPVSLPVLAKQETGISLDSLNRINDVQRIADSETVSEELRLAAQKGLRKIVETGKVEPVWKNLIKMQERAEAAGDDPSVRRAEELEASVDALMNQLTLFSDRLDREDEAAVFIEAGKNSSVNRDNISAARHAAARMVVALVNIEAESCGDASRAVLDRTVQYVEKVFEEARLS